MKYILIIIEPKGFCARLLWVPSDQFCKTEHYFLFKKHAIHKNIENAEIDQFLYNEIEWHSNRGKYITEFADSAQYMLNVADGFENIKGSKCEWSSGEKISSIYCMSLDDETVTERFIISSNSYEEESNDEQEPRPLPTLFDFIDISADH